MNAQQTSLNELKDQVSKLIQELTKLEPFRQGSLTARYHTCGKAYCHCSQKNDPGHGPYWTLSRAVKGKNIAKTISPDAVDLTKQQIARFHKFQKIIEQIREVNIRICDAQLEERKAASKGAEKRAKLKNQDSHRRRNY